ncbi:CLUMA_CG012588, isoform A [Clunio marinus]|uniref:CLUMA_CG012588, isoform A n=1 Tax=Clunio marinus TaxID=568069 RepID=A0A1J1IGB5_9DIPT|nr:CLUMA_CG012588, isoform A [Clunio marinus]
MVKISLQISCILENIEELKPGQNYSYFLKLRCNNCGEADDIWHDLCEDEKVQQDSRNAKGYNFVIKCKLCGRENSLDVVEGSQGSYKEDDAGKFKSIITFDCRGIEPTDFDPRSGFIVKSIENGQSFDDVEIEDGDWTEYDDKNKNSVSISEFKSQFIKLKGKKMKFLIFLPLLSFYFLTADGRNVSGNVIDKVISIAISYLGQGLRQLAMESRVEAEKIINNVYSSGVEYGEIILSIDNSVCSNDNDLEFCKTIKSLESVLVDSFKEFDKYKKDANNIFNKAFEAYIAELENLMKRKLEPIKDLVQKGFSCLVSEARKMHKQLIEKAEELTRNYLDKKLATFIENIKTRRDEIFKISKAIASTYQSCENDENINECLKNFETNGGDIPSRVRVLINEIIQLYVQQLAVIGPNMVQIERIIDSQDELAVEALKACNLLEL